VTRAILILSRITRHLCTGLVKEAVWSWYLCCCQLGLILKLEIG
jgi:hypothetical protein